MFLSTFGEMKILHHNTKIGGDLICPQAEHFELCGLNEVAIPFKFKPKSILMINEIDAPSCPTIQSIKTPEDLEVARDATPNLRHFTSAISTPSYLTQALMILRGPSASDVYMEIIRISEVFETEK